MLLTIIACGDGGGETSPTAAVQSTIPSTSTAQGGESTPVPQLTLTPEVIPTEIPPEGIIGMAIDVDTTGNTADTLGPLDSCVRIDVPSPSFDDVSDYNIDIVVTGAIQGPLGYNAQLNWDNTAAVHVADPGTDPVIKMPPDASRADLSDARPDSDGQWNAGVAYLGAVSGTPGDGTITRVGLDIGGTGLVTFTLSPEPLTDYGSSLGNHTTVVDPNGGMLAINTDCPQ
jgi:hypothetical protein